MTRRYAYEAGVARCVVEDGPDFIAYRCGPLQSRRIEKAWITAVGISDDRHVLGAAPGAGAIRRATGVKGELLGLLIAYAPPGARRPVLATITYDDGVAACQALVRAVTEEFAHCFLGTNTRGALMRAMNVKMTSENLLIAAILGAVALISALITWW